MDHTEINNLVIIGLGALVIGVTFWLWHRNRLNEQKKENQE